jgi:NAD(P)-dependent dehydrogenase (short-subunit alcohol dehydrogenase family)
MIDKICLVTGATDGLGKVTARALAESGATVIGVGRDPAKIEAVLSEVGDIPGSLEFLTADLSSQEQIRTLVEQFKRKYDRLHVLVNNAGALFTSFRESVDGIEMTFALNHLSYFLLTNLLLDTITASPPSRIINVASSVHEGSTINFDDLEHRKKYGGWAAYGASKLANILFTYEVARRLQGTGVTVNAVHPGFVRTNFHQAARVSPSRPITLKRLARAALRIVSGGEVNIQGPLTPEKGADTQIWLATSDEVEGITGKYFVQRRDTRSSDISYDKSVARRLWNVSAGMAKLPHRVSYLRCPPVVTLLHPSQWHEGVHFIQQKRRLSESPPNSTP